MPTNKKTLYTVLLVSVILIALFAVVFTGSDNLLKTITGRLSTTNVTITISNSAPVSGNLSFIGAVNVVESTQNPINFSFTATDGDGVAQFNDSTVDINFTLRYAGWSEAVRTNVTFCTRVDIDAFTVNYSCSIPIWYYDAPAIWNVSFSVRDISNAGFVNVTGNFTIQSSTGITINPGNITFSSLSLNSVNQTANQNVNVTNTANYNVSRNNTRMTSIDLAGVQAPAYKIFAENFTGASVAGIINGSNTNQCERTVGNGTSTNFTNGTATSVPGTIVTRGNQSIGIGTNQSLFVCLSRIGNNLTQQAYSTTQSQAWTVSVV